MTFGLSSESWKIVYDLAIEPLKSRGCKVWVYGSRARGDHRPFSDLDLLFEAPSLVPLSVQFEIKDNLEQSDLPIKIDLVDLATLAENYKDNILSDRVLIEAQILN